jgi:hypothetical protein
VNSKAEENRQNTATSLNYIRGSQIYLCIPPSIERS